MSGSAAIASSSTSSKKKIELKLILVGPANAGKTCLVTRYIQETFGSRSATVGAAFFTKVLSGRRCGIWDTAGEEKFDSLSAWYSRGAAGALLCYDITQRESFDNLEKYVNMVRKSAPECCFCVVGTKLDLVTANAKRRSVTAAEGMELGLRLNGMFFETSAKENIGIDQTFASLATKCVAKLIVNGTSSCEGIDLSSHVGQSESVDRKCC